MIKKRVICALAALATAFCMAGCANTSSTESPSPSATQSQAGQGGEEEKTLVAKVDDMPVLLKDVQNQFDSYKAYYMEGDLEGLRDDIIEMAVNDAVIKVRVQKEGLFPVSEDGNKQVDQQYEEVLSEWREQLRSMLASSADFAEATEEEIAEEVETRLQAFMDDMGYTEAYLKELLSYNYAAEKLYEKYTDNITVTEEEVKAQYDTLVEKDKTSFAEDLTAFEYAESYYYAPEGYKKIKHIYKSITDEQEAEIKALREEGKDEEADALEKQYMGPVKEEMESLRKTLTAENFDEKMQAETQDPGLASYPNGYVVSPDPENTSFDKTFTETAGKLQKVGDISEVIQSSMGYHILFYAEEIPAGPVAYDSVKESVQKELLEDKKANVYEGLLKEWRSEMKVETYPERVNMGTAEPSAEPSGTVEPSAEPSGTVEPSAEPSGTVEPSAEPSGTAEPSAEPSGTAEPSAEPSGTAKAS